VKNNFKYTAFIVLLLLVTYFVFVFLINSGKSCRCVNLDEHIKTNLLSLYLSAICKYLSYPLYKYFTGLVNIPYVEKTTENIVKIIAQDFLWFLNKSSTNIKNIKAIIGKIFITYLKDIYGDILTIHIKDLYGDICTTIVKSKIIGTTKIMYIPFSLLFMNFIINKINITTEIKFPNIIV